MSALGYIVGYPIAFFIGFKLRPWIPKGKAFVIGFTCTMVLLSILLAIELLFLSDRKILHNAVGTAIAIGFGHGIVFLEMPTKRK
jgi:hypothetical protein